VVGCRLSLAIDLFWPCNACMHTYEEMAEALPRRSVGAVRGKLGRRKREKREDTYIGGGGVCTQRSRPSIFPNH